MTVDFECQKERLLMSYGKALLTGFYINAAVNCPQRILVDDCFGSCLTKLMSNSTFYFGAQDRKCLWTRVIIWIFYFDHHYIITYHINRIHSDIVVSSRWFWARDSISLSIRQTFTKLRSPDYEAPHNVHKGCTKLSDNFEQNGGHTYTRPLFISLKKCDTIGPTVMRIVVQFPMIWPPFL